MRLPQAQDMRSGLSRSKDESFDHMIVQLWPAPSRSPRELIRVSLDASPAISSISNIVKHELQLESSPV